MVINLNITIFDDQHHFNVKANRKIWIIAVINYLFKREAMTVTTSINYKEYQADGKATIFTIPFLLLARNDLQIYLDNEPINLTYTIRGLGNPISEIIFEKAPIGRLLLQRSIELVRETDYQENGDLLAKTVNQDFDRIYLAMQGLAQDNTKALRVVDSDGVNPLPLAAQRANKTFFFDSTGQPMLATIETGSAADLAKNLADSSDQHKGASLVSYNNELNYPIKTVGKILQQLQERCDYFEGNGVPVFTVFWWPSRQTIPAGYVVADGQELSQAVYPDIAKAIQRGDVPTVSETEWQSNPSRRGSYVAYSSPGQFRLPDYNGRSADSLGALFLRGDSGAIKNGEIQKDGVGNVKIPVKTSSQGVAHFIYWFDSKTHLMPAPDFANNGWNQRADVSLSALTNHINEMNLGDTETRPLNISGCWIIKLVTAVINQAEVNVQQLITDNAKLLARLSVLESWQQAKRFIIIYPNGGTEASPANVEVNKRYIEANPFPHQTVICQAEILVNEVWAETGSFYFAWSSGGGGFGVLAHHLIETDQIVVQTGSWRVMYASNKSLGGHGINNMELITAPCRVKVWRIV